MIVDVYIEDLWPVIDVRRRDSEDPYTQTTSIDIPLELFNNYMVTKAELRQYRQQIWDAFFEQRPDEAKHYRR